MASYEFLDPTLAALSVALANPTGDEAANKWPDVDAQTRQFIYDYLSAKFGSLTEKLLPAVVDDTTLAGKVKGSVSNAGAQQGVVQGTISTPDLRDAAVATAKIADNAVTSAKIATGQVLATHLGSKVVAAVAIADNTITATQMAAASVDATVLKSDATGAAGAVTAEHLRTGAVTAAKLGAQSVGADALMVGSVAGQLLLAGTAPYKFAAKTMSGDATIDQNGLLTLTTKQTCELVERTNNGVAAGGAVTGTWQIRGAATNWVEAWRVPVASFATFDAGGKVTLPVGTYYVEASAPAFKTGKHICRLVRYNVSNVVQETFYGSSSTSPAAAALVTTTSVKAKITVANSNDYLQLEHYSELTEAVDGLGQAASSGGTYEVYARMLIQRLS